ncbi:MAG TPA: transcription termination/antitermination NusG family protein [Thermoanaerobaculia bacterium]|jgi:transcription antitermination factor NusG
MFERLPEMTGETERGGALTGARWYAIWTRSHSEQLVADQLFAKGLRVFLPKMSIWSRRGGIRHVIQVPMFSGYVFLNESVDKNKYIDVIKARGVVRLLGERWDRLSPISDGEIEGLQKVLDAGLPVTPHSYLREGQRVRITGGPLKGVEGLLVQNRPQKGILVLSVDLLRQSVAVQIDCTWVAAA